ncbi:LysR family transcriptional regulator [Leisingera methylohalidivorans]|uniref:LysR family transcriptional regulator n=1 Tax=Leisingera methylohalidivorans TaxID=133924 RepID=UPI0024816270|nr:LysR family transcriptional regulator [Leisingera methylohalidivorans]
MRHRRFGPVINEEAGCCGLTIRYSLDEIETFLTVMELGTVTATAARLNLSKSVISKRISDFELSVGAALFRRNAGRITATESALQLAERLRPALTELVAAAESAASENAINTSLQGSLAITAPMSFGTMFLSEILADFARTHPGLDLRIDYDDRARDLLREGYDIGIRIGDARDAHLMQRKLCEDRQIVVASADYLARHGNPETLADLRNHQVLSYAHLSDAMLWQFSENGRTVSPQVAGRITLNNGEAMREMAIGGVGLAILPGFVVSSAIREGKLQRVLPDCAARTLPVLAVWPPISPMPAKLRVLIDHMVSCLSEQRPWDASPDFDRQGGMK